MIKLTIMLLVLLITLAACSNNSPTGNVIGDESDFVKIPISDITEEMKKYAFDANGIEVRYFTVMGSDGEIRTAFDACDVCGGSKGYRQQGQDVVCNNCGKFYDIDDLGTQNVGGGCWPSFLKHQVQGDHILISKVELSQGAFRFA